MPDGSVLGAGINILVTYTYTDEITESLRSVISVTSTNEPVVVSTQLGFCKVLRIERHPDESWGGDEDYYMGDETICFPEWRVELPDGYTFIISLQDEDDVKFLQGVFSHTAKKKVRFETRSTTEKFNTIADLKKILVAFVPGIETSSLEIGRVSFYFDVIGHQDVTVFDSGVIDTHVLSDPNVWLRKRLREFLAPLKN